MGKITLGGKVKKKKSKIVTGLLIAASILLAIGCDTGGSNDGGDPNVYAIGDTGPAGGLIFYVDEADSYSWTYLEAAPNDHSTLQVWIAGGSTQTTENGDTGTAIGTGLENTIALIAQVDHIGSAAQVCRDYDGGGLTDWFLPSKDELKQMYVNLHLEGVGGFANEYYWSSSENGSNGAWCQYFSTGIQTIADKDDYDIRIRAVRAF